MAFNLDSDPTDSVMIDVDQVITMPATANWSYYSVKQPNKPGWVEVFGSYALNANIVGSRHRRSADGVVMLTANWNDVASWCCTGLVIAAGPKMLVLTNHHCGGPSLVNDKNSVLHIDPDLGWDTANVCSTMIADSSWDGDSIPQEFQCRRVVAKNKLLDAAILEFEPKERYSLVPTPIKLRRIAANAPVLQNRATIDGALVHHPRCGPKALSTRCAIRSLIPGSPTILHHDCDSELGSSGSPLFADNGRDLVFIGLHRAGYEALNGGKCDMINKAVFVNEIVDWIEREKAQNETLRGVITSD
jgi:hypothetical protein